MQRGNSEDELLRIERLDDMFLKTRIERRLPNFQTREGGQRDGR